MFWGLRLSGLPRLRPRWRLLLHPAPLILQVEEVLPGAPARIRLQPFVIVGFSSYRLRILESYVLFNPGLCYGCSLLCAARRVATPTTNPPSLFTATRAEKTIPKTQTKAHAHAHTHTNKQTNKQTKKQTNTHTHSGVSNYFTYSSFLLLPIV